MLELLEIGLLLFLLLLFENIEELLLIFNELLETSDEEDTITRELELPTDEENTTTEDELEGVLSPARLLDTTAVLLDGSDELLKDEDFTELVSDEDCVVPFPFVMPPPPPQAVSAAEREIAETIRME